VLGPDARQLALLLRNWARTSVRQVVKYSASSSHSHSKRNKAAAQTGRHRAPSGTRKTIKIISAAAVVAGVAGGFAGYKVTAPQADPVANTVATYHHQRLSAHGVLAAGSAEQMQLGTAGSKTRTSDKSDKSKSAPSPKPSKTAARQPATASHHRRSRNSGSAPAPSSASGQGGGQTAPTPTPSPSASASSSGSASLKALVKKDIADGNYELAVGEYLVENGYSKAGAAGVVGCIDGESGGNPESVGSGGGGLIGWTPISAAAPNPNIITGNPATDMMTQLEDLLYYNSNEIGQSLVSQLNAISDPVQAADFFSQNFEKPAVLDSDVRPSTAEEIYSELGG
jgi:Phage tail lysozyme